LNFSNAPEGRQVWQFITGHSTAREFETWLYSDPGIEGIFGETLCRDLIAADYRDRYVVADLRERLFKWVQPFLPRRWQSLQFDNLYPIDLGNGSIRRLLFTGYWHAGEEDNLPNPRDYVDEHWDETERNRVIEYLADAYVVIGYMGFSWCRMGCPELSPPSDIGTKDLTDGTWIFPEGLVHYLRHHSVKPEADFLEHVRGTGYRMADLPLRRARVDSPHRR
jgi:hypothetical protein